MGIKELMRTSAVSDGACDRKKPNMIVIWIIIAAVAVLAAGSFLGGDSDKEEAAQPSTDDTTEYVREQEARLEKILKMINGAGDVSVFISIEGGGEKILARDDKFKLTEDTATGSAQSREEESESSVVMSGKGSGSEPYVVEEKTPQIAGILVVAEGAANEKVRLEIYEAVKAVYGVSPHRIKVTY